MRSSMKIHKWVYQCSPTTTIPNGDTLAIDSFGPKPSNGTVTQNNDILVYTRPTTDFNGSDSFSYTINDGNGNTDSATVFRYD